MGKRCKDEGVLLLFETTPEFYAEQTDGKSSKETKQSFSFLYTYLFKHKKAVLQLFIGLIATSLLQLIFPFLMQSIVDIGVQNKDIQFIYLILLAQFDGILWQNYH